MNQIDSELDIDPSKNDLNLKSIIGNLCNTRIRTPISFENTKSWLKQFNQGPEYTLGLLILRFLIFRNSLQLQSSLKQALKEAALHFLPPSIDRKKTHWRSILNGAIGNLKFSYGPPESVYTQPGKSGELVTRQLKQCININSDQLWYLADTTNLKENEVFLIVDDGIYTGQQIDACITTCNSNNGVFTSNPNQIAVVVGFAHEEGLKFLRSKYKNLPIFYGELLTAEHGFEVMSKNWIVDNIWPYKDVTPYEVYMQIYERTGLDKGPWGWGALGCMVAYEHGIPDDSLSLLHGKSDSWNPLFLR